MSPELRNAGPLQWWVMYPDGREAGPYPFKWAARLAALLGKHRA